jgi:hypothetical protein
VPATPRAGEFMPPSGRRYATHHTRCYRVWHTRAWPSATERRGAAFIVAFAPFTGLPAAAGCQAGPLGLAWNGAEFICLCVLYRVLTGLSRSAPRATPFKRGTAERGARSIPGVKRAGPVTLRESR